MLILNFAIIVFLKRHFRDNNQNSVDSFFFLQCSNDLLPKRIFIYLTSQKINKYSLNIH